MIRIQPAANPESRANSLKNENYPPDATSADQRRLSDRSCCYRIPAICLHNFSRLDGEFTGATVLRGGIGVGPVLEGVIFHQLVSWDSEKRPPPDCFDWHNMAESCRTQVE